MDARQVHRSTRTHTLRAPIHQYLGQLGVLLDPSYKEYEYTQYEESIDILVHEGMISLDGPI